MSPKLDYIVATGEYIDEWMESEGINAAELARRLGATPKHISELLSGKASLSAKVALDLERVTGIPARMWNMYEAGYRSGLAERASESDLVAEYEQARRFPLAYLRKCGFIDAAPRDHSGIVRQLLKLLGVASLSAFTATWSTGSVAYRRSAIGRDDAAALATWLVLAERHRDGIQGVPRYDRDGLEALLPRLRALTARTDPAAAAEEARELLHTVGAVLCFIPAVPGLGIYGATRWVSGTPIVQLSLLRKTDDQLWFTLFHEIGHILLHSDRGLYLTGDKRRVGDETALKAEAEADRYATDLLIPPEYATILPTGRDISGVEAAATQLGIAPSIVLGRVQHETGDYGWGHGLKRKLEFANEEA